MTFRYTYIHSFTTLYRINKYTKEYTHTHKLHMLCISIGSSSTKGHSGPDVFIPYIKPKTFRTVVCLLRLTMFEACISSSSTSHRSLALWSHTTIMRCHNSICPPLRRHSCRVSPVSFPLIVLVRTCTQVVAVLASWLLGTEQEHHVWWLSRCVCCMLFLLLLWDGCICMFRHCSCCVCVCQKWHLSCRRSTNVNRCDARFLQFCLRVFLTRTHTRVGLRSRCDCHQCHYRETKEHKHTHTHTTSPSPYILVCIVCGWPVMSGYIPVEWERTTAVHGHSWLYCTGHTTGTDTVRVRCMCFTWHTSTQEICTS